MKLVNRFKLSWLHLCSLTSITSNSSSVDVKSLSSSKTNLELRFKVKLSSNMTVFNHHHQFKMWVSPLPTKKLAFRFMHLWFMADALFRVRLLRCIFYQYVLSFRSLCCLNPTMHCNPKVSVTSRADSRGVNVINAPVGHIWRKWHTTHTLVWVWG